MKKLYLILALTIFFVNVGAQNQNYPKGLYMSLEEIRSKTPSQQLDLALEKRSRDEIFMNGGNDYKLSSDDKSIKRKFLKKAIFAYSDGDTLYLNCFHLNIQTWYAKVISDGRYMIFKGVVSPQHSKYQGAMMTGIMFGAIGAAIATDKLVDVRLVYLFDKESGEVEEVNKETIVKRLGDRSDLLMLYENEINKDQKADSILLKYILLFNEDRLPADTTNQV